MSQDRKYLVWALCYAAFGMGLGIFMAASHDHSQHVTHAHILLVGFVASLVYGVIHKLWLGPARTRLGGLQFVTHHAGAITMFTGLLLLYGNIVPEADIEPVLALASMAVLAGMLLMLFMVLRSGAAEG